jgi:hypothetical protein
MHSESNPEGPQGQAIDAPLESSCPLCGRIVPHQDLYPHFNRDWSAGFLGAVQMIKAYHPDWVEDQGVCFHCWRSYAEASRVIHSLRYRTNPANASRRLSIQ